MQSVCDTMNFNEFSTYINYALILKHLIRKGIVQKEFCVQQIDRYLKDQNPYQQSISESQNLDSSKEILRMAMKISAFASTQIIDEKAALICQMSHSAVMTGPLNLSKNRIFLGLIKELFIIFAHLIFSH